MVVCSIENFDPMGVHTGDSITVAPAQTLTDVEYQAMRDDAFACLRRVGVETGGSNVQFAVDPATGRRVIIEMNPRVSRSSALASKATGFPIAKIAARLAVGYRLDEIPNDITRATPACFEPTIDYVVTKVPRWAFEKLPGAEVRLGTRMQSVGEVMAIGRTFCESLQKALRSLEQGRAGLNADPAEVRARRRVRRRRALDRIAVPPPSGSSRSRRRCAAGVTRRDVVAAHRHRPVVRAPAGPHHRRTGPRSTAAPMHRAAASCRRAKRLGLLRRPAGLPAAGAHEAEVRADRLAPGCAPPSRPSTPARAEFEAFTPYHYSTYEDEDEVRPSERDRVVILGSGPNRIGQGIEFDYCCVHASMALRDAGYETVMVNCNPETVSTDYDTSDRLYFEPLTDEDVANVLDAERRPAARWRASSSRSAARPRSSWPAPSRPSWCSAPARRPSTWPRTASAGTRCATSSASPSPPAGPPPRRPRRWPSPAGSATRCSLRPSYVLGGRAMEIVYDDDGVRRVMQSMTTGALAREGGVTAERPVLVDRFLEDAIEVDVDAVRDDDRRDPDRRGHGARRGGRRALGRLGLRPAAPDPRRRGRRRPRAPHPRPGRGARACAACSTCSSP